MSSFRRVIAAVIILVACCLLGTSAALAHGIGIDPNGAAVAVE